MSEAVKILENCGWRRVIPAGDPPPSVAGYDLPEEYLGVLRWTDGGSARLGPSPLSCIELWSAAELGANQDLVGKYMPGALSIGGDGATREFVIDFRLGSPGAVLSVDRGDMGWSCDTLRTLGATLAEALGTLRDVPASVDHPSFIGRTLTDP